jgi:hypothetical protein
LTKKIALYAAAALALAAGSAIPANLPSYKPEALAKLVIHVAESST